MKNGFQILYDWMVSDLHLKGSSVQVFAIIYGFTRNGQTCEGSLQFFADKTGCTKQTVLNLLKKLEEKHYIRKEQIRAKDGGVRNHYTAAPEILNRYDSPKQDVETVENAVENPDTGSYFFTPGVKKLECPQSKFLNAPSQKIRPNSIDRNISQKDRGEHGGKPLRPQAERFVFGACRNVFLTADEYNQLKATYGEQLDITLTSFSCWMAEQHRSYQNHFAMLTKWCMQDQQRSAPKKHTRTTATTDWLAENGAFLERLSQTVPTLEIEKSAPKGQALSGGSLPVYNKAAYQQSQPYHNTFLPICQGGDGNV